MFIMTIVDGESEGALVACTGLVAHCWLWLSVVVVQWFWCLFVEDLVYLFFLSNLRALFRVSLLCLLLSVVKTTYHYGLEQFEVVEMVEGDKQGWFSARLRSAVEVVGVDVLSLLCMRFVVYLSSEQLFEEMLIVGFDDSN